MNLFRPTRVRGGFTLAELMAVIVILGILAALASPRVYRTVTRSKVNEAAGVIAADLEQAVGLAARQRRPVRLALESAGTYTLRDRATAPNDSLRLRRRLTMASDGGVETLTFSRTPVQIFPNGSIDGALTVTVSGAGQTRTITLSPAGQVRIN